MGLPDGHVARHAASTEQSSFFWQAFRARSTQGPLSPSAWRTHVSQGSPSAGVVEFWLHNDAAHSVLHCWQLQSTSRFVSTSLPAG